MHNNSSFKKWPKPTFNNSFQAFPFFSTVLVCAFLSFSSLSIIFFSKLRPWTLHPLRLISSTLFYYTKKARAISPIKGGGVRILRQGNTRDDAHHNNEHQTNTQHPNKRYNKKKQRIHTNTCSKNPHFASTCSVISSHLGISPPPSGPNNFPSTL